MAGRFDVGIALLSIGGADLIRGLAADKGRGVLAFGFGLVLGLSFDAVPAPDVEADAAYAGPAGTTADEPVAAERRYAGRREPVPPAETPTPVRFLPTWDATLLVHARRTGILAEERPAVLCGDWNVVPEDRDVFSVRATQHDAVMQPGARQLWRRIVNQGWTDALRALHPAEEKLYTFWDYTAGCWQRDLGFRLDHLLCSPEAADRMQGAGVDKWARGEEKASDHAPTWIELN